MAITNMSKHIQTVQSTAECLHSAEQVEQASIDLARQITSVLSDKDPLILCVMNGAVIPTALIMRHLNFPLRLDYIHATRYRGDTRGGELEWIRHPAQPLEGQHLLIIDDIFDEGITLDLIVEQCQAERAASVRTAVLAEKLCARACDYRPDFIGLQVEDRYVFGAGMDYKEYLRNVPGIYAVANEHLHPG